MPDQIIFDVLQEESGLYWFATNSGLYSFDGQDFTLHRHEEQKGRSVFNLTFDNQGALWFNNISGQIFRYTKDSIALVETLVKNDFVGLKPITKTQEGILAYDDKRLLQFREGQVDTLDAYNEMGPSSKSVQEGGSTLIWRMDTLYQIKGASCSVLRTYKELPEHGGRVSLFNINNRIFVHLFGSGVNYIYDISGTEKILMNDFGALKGVSIIRVVKKGNKLWFLTGGGAFCYRYSKGQFILEKHWLEGKTVTDLLEDREGFLWFATLDKGVYILPCQDCERLDLFYEKDRVISELMALGDSVLYFISNRSSVNRLNTLNNRFIKKEFSLFHNHYFTRNPFTGDLLFFAGGRLKYLDPINLTLRKEIKSPVPKALAALNKKAHVGAYYYGVRLFPDNFKEVGIKSVYDRGRTLALSNDLNDIYIAHPNSFRYTDKELETQSFILNEGKEWSPKLLHSQSGSNRVWASTESSISAYESGKMVKELNVESGLHDEVIQSLTSDRKHLFIAYKHHLQAYNLEKDTIINFPYYLFLKNAIIREITLAGDRLLINTGEEIYRIPKRHFAETKNYREESLYLKFFEINGVPVDIRASYALDDKADRIVLGVALNKAFPSDRFEYLYRWNEESQWQSFPTGANRLVLDNIPHGNNRVSIRAAAKFADRFSESIHVDIYRAFPWWRQWWFYALMALGMAALSYTVVSYNHHRKRKNLQMRLERVQNEQEIIHLQLENLRSQMNPHFVFNALNSIQDYIVSNERKLATKFLVKFSRLMRLYLEHSQSAEITLEEEIEALELYLALEQDRFDQSLQFELSVAPSLALKRIVVPSLLLQPYVENALNHGLLHKEGNRFILIAFEELNSQLICTIEDNGIGRKTAQKLRERSHHNSFSTRANADRIALINRNLDRKLAVETEDLYTDSGLPAGTRVRINIPIRHENNHH